MKKYDLIVVGGGFSGVCSALSASRLGLKVLLVEKNNCLGGAATNALVVPFMDYWTYIDGKKFYLSRGVFYEIVGELKKANAIQDNEMTFDYEYLKVLLNRMVIKEGVDLLFNAICSGVNSENGQIKSLDFITRAGNISYEADYVIDCTGDATIVDKAGFSTRLGREEDKLCQPMTLCFRVGGVDIEEFKKQKPEFNPLYKKYKEEGKIKNMREDVLVFHTTNNGVVHFNSTRVCKRNPIDPVEVTLAEIEAREQVYELFDFLKANFTCFKNAEIIMTAAETGVRESRMINGEYLLTVKDIVDCVKFDDSIATGNYDIDIHNPNGSDTSHYYFPNGQYYTIPYRTLIPKGAKNVLVAGRSISVDHETQASIRIMPICATLGQAAGTAIAIAKKEGKGVGEIDIKVLQKQLEKDGAYLGI